MAKLLRAGKMSLVIIIPLIITGFILFGISYFSVAQADLKTEEEVPLEVQQLNEDAESYIAAKQYDLAEQTYYEIVAAYPGTEYATEALGEAGLICVKQSKNESVSNVIDQLYASYSTQLKVTLAIDRLAEGYLLKDEISAAEDIYSDAIAQMPDHENVLWLHTGLIKCKIARKEFIAAEEAIATFKNTYSSHSQLCENIYSLIKPYRRIKEINKVRDIYQYVASNSSDTILAIKCQAQVADCEIRLGNYFSADQAVQELLNRFEGHKDLCSKLNPLAYKYWVRDKYDKARDLYQYISQNCSDINSKIEAQASVADCEIKLGNYNSADQAIEILYGYSEYDDFIIAITKLAKSFRDTGQNAKAIIIIEDYVAKKSSAFADLGLRTELALNDIAIGNLNEIDDYMGYYMQNAYDNGLVVDPNSADPNSPSTYEMEPFRQIFPVFEALFTEGNKQICKARPNYANHYFKKAIELGKFIDEKLPAPKREYLSTELCLMIAEGYRNEGQYKKAITYLEKAINNWPQNKYTSQAEFVLKNCYRRLGMVR